MKKKFNSERLRQVLAGRRLSVFEAALAAKMSTETMQRLAYGKYMFGHPRLPTLHKLSEAFNVPIEEWLIEEE